MKRIWASIVCIFCLSVTAPQGADRYQRWIEREVCWIASRAEVENFKQLQTEAEKEAFIARFWQRRDPTPGTPRNEYKEEHQRRLQYANQNFREGVPGWKTDRGRIYIIHGEPDRVEYMMPDRIGDQETIIWTYFEMPTASYFKGRMIVVFKAQIGTTLQDVTLGESRTGRRQANRNLRRGGRPQTELVRNAVRYRLVAAGPPAAINNRGLDIPASGIGEFAHYVEDLTRSPGELLEENDREIRRREASRDELRQEIQSRVSYDRLPFSMSAHEFPSGDESVLSLAWQIPLSSLDFQRRQGLHQAQIDIVAQVMTASGELVDEFFKSIELAYPPEEWEERKAGVHHYLNHFSVDPGQYRVTSVIRDVRSGKLGTASAEVEVTGLESGRISLSDLVLSRTMIEADETEAGRELTHQEWKVIPESDTRFSNSDHMVLYFKVYNANPTEDGRPEVVVTYRFFQGDKLIKNSGPRPLREFTDPDGRTISYGTVLDLNNFEPGDYLLQVNAIDFQTKQFAFQRTDFRIDP